MSGGGWTGLILGFGGVLTSGVAECAADFDRRAGLPDGTFLATISEDPVGSGLFAELERGAISQSDWNVRTGALLGMDGTGLLGRVLEGLRPEPSVIAAVERARAAGVRVGVFSNSLGGPYDPFDVYAGYDLPERFDVVLLSGEYGMRKPDPELYGVMLERMGMPGERCVFVDDTARNLPPARDLGLATVLASEPARTIADVEALLGIPLTGEA
ncbi:HAD-IA family hydrolase [Streptomyces clavuligerus]|uniref:HAD-superfamily hydrolase, subfamily IA, variant 3 n=1 Tax=Streptomyces clavuligerus TaxID=1901 RepID=B5GMV7_STRCL|nr:HAD-IA family hydrolase [Streptomyces clavuligerus]ANW22283.1 haloacid dehalogenase [Streptomyces clavuligerus]AXU17178.1 HAD family hydrolase [Streptomyces clavuligerus]EDY47653.1 HAD-superfamily hydrolase subfamily IA [Streptomyces clavuligerus]EFG04353.1 HAD-superfamily hydrolase, subfamily IA, variant 3 [Streptomyces clavuligerus]MBY6307176.1 HAD-IA family hydrolase [Streptomyces clavuligerus]